MLDCGASVSGATAKARGGCSSPSRAARPTLKVPLRRPPPVQARGAVAANSCSCRVLGLDQVRGSYVVTEEFDAGRTGGAAEAARVVEETGRARGGELKVGGVLGRCRVSVGAGGGAMPRVFWCGRSPRLLMLSGRVEICRCCCGHAESRRRSWAELPEPGPGVVALSLGCRPGRRRSRAVGGAQGDLEIVV